MVLTKRDEAAKELVARLEQQDSALCKEAAEMIRADTVRVQFYREMLKQQTRASIKAA